MKTEYRVIGRFVCDKEPHLVRGGRHEPNLTKKQAEKAIADIIKKQEMAKKKGEFNDGLVSTPYYDEYELVDLKVQSRQVSEWS